MFEQLKNKLNHPLLKNSIFNSGGFVFISLVGLILTPLLVHYFGYEQYGVYVLVTGIFGYYGIFDFGLGQALIKFVAEYKAQEDIQKLNDAVNSIFWFQFLVGLLLSIIIYLGSEWIIQILHVSPEYVQESVIALKIATIGFLFTMLSASFGAANKGLERYDITSTIDSLSYLMINVLLVVVLIKGFGIKEAVMVNVGVAILQFIIQAYAFKKLNTSYRLRLVFQKPIIKEFFSFSAYLFLSKITGILRQQGTRLIISLFLNPAAVTLYVVPSKLLTAVGGVLSSAAGTLFPYISKLNAVKNKKQIQVTFIKANIAFAFISLPILLFITFFSKSILTLWMGVDFAEKSWLILSLLTLGSIFGSMTTIPINTVLGLGFSRLILFFSIFSLLFYLIFLPFFTYAYGVLGAALAMLVINSLNILIVLIKTVSSIDIGFRWYLKKVFKYHVIPMLIYSSLSLLLTMVFKNSTLYAFGVGILMLLGYYYYFLQRYFLEFQNMRI